MRQPPASGGIASAITKAPGLPGTRGLTANGEADTMERAAGGRSTQVVLVPEIAPLCAVPSNKALPPQAGALPRPYGDAPTRG